MKLSHSDIELLEARIAPAFAAVFELSTLDGSNGFKLSGVAGVEHSGSSVSDAGDVNGDGFADFIVGAPYASPNGFHSGASYVIFGKATGFPNLNLSALDGSNGFKLSGIAGYDRSGSSVSAAGDVNGDGFGDLIIGAPGAGPNRNSSGASYVVFGKAAGFAPNLNLSALDGSNGFKLNGVAAADISGQSVSAAGDVNGDGFADVIIGAPSADPNGNFSGASYVVFGKASGFAANFNLSTLNGANGFKLSGVAPGDGSGWSVSAAGDVNGDGFGDLIIGAYGADPNGNYSGATYVVFGKASGFAANLNLSTLDGANGFKLSGVAGGDRSGDSVSGAGDLNGDGFDDVIVGAFGAGPNSSGASYVVFGNASGFAANLNLSELDGSNGFKLSGAAANDFAGIVSAAGDVNGDGFDDVIIGAPRAHPNGPNSGASYIVFGKASGFAANLNLSSLDGRAGFKLNGVAAGDFSGNSVSGAGDVNGDGFGDLIIGAPSANSTGASYVIFGAGPTLSISDASVAEGSGGTTALTFTVSLSEAGINPVNVGVATGDETATEGSDYTAVQTQLFFAPGELSKTVTVNVIGDTLFESDETFLVNIFSKQAVMRNDTATGTIRTDDAPPVVSIAAGSVIEGDSGTSSLAFTVSLSAASGLPASVNFASADGTALAGSDYTALTPGALTFAPGETTKTILVEVVGDTSIEDHETFSIVLSNASGATIGAGTAMATILNEDTAVLIRGPADGLEGDSGAKPFVFTIVLENESALPVTVSYTSADGTATGGSDFTAIDLTQIIFAPGETTKTIAVDVLGDAEAEAHEIFSVVLSDAVNATITSGAATGTILNDDSLIRIGDESLLEGHSGARALVFTVTLTAPSALPVSVDFASADRTATAGADYIALTPGTLEFAPGETTKTIIVDLLGDTDVDPAETFSVLLSNATNAVIEDAEGIGTILDDDVELVGARKATFVDVDGDLVTIKISKGALNVEDFTLFPSGDGSQLALVDFRGQTEFAGANLMISARTAPGGLAGNGVVNVGYLDATGVDLGKVTIKGDIAQIDIGDGDAAKPALKALSVASIGTRGLGTQLPGAGASLHSDFDGDLRMLKVKGSVTGGATLAIGGRLDSATIGGNLDGATISVLGLLNSDKTSDALAIGTLAIAGDVANSRILAGYDRTGAAANADASIDRIFAGGNWRASDLVAGIAAGPDTFFGTADDALIPGGNALLGSIASIVIKGAASGTEGDNDHYGFVAEQIVGFKAQGSKLTLKGGPANDLASVGETGDLTLREVG